MSSDSEIEYSVHSDVESDFSVDEFAPKQTKAPKTTAKTTAAKSKSTSEEVKKPIVRKTTAKKEDGALKKLTKKKSSATLVASDSEDDHFDEEVSTLKAKSSKKASGSKTIEETYQKKTQLEHILLRPDTYIGSVETAQNQMWVYEGNRLVYRNISYVPGLYKIFDEILVNASDNKIRDPKMDTIKVKIDQENNEISVHNNGKGIPVEIHTKEKVYVPELIFGHLLTSSNYDDDEKKVTGGRNGYGAKLCNIFSTQFTVETSDSNTGKSFKQ
ncbi:DNA topoisomerase 2, partial [Nowakowskiella sp. JEL0078]